MLSGAVVAGGTVTSTVGMDLGALSILHPVRPEVAEWEQLFLRGRLRTDVSKKVIEEFGFMEYVWNAKTKERTRVEFSCGAYSPGAVNSCLFKPPR